MTEKKRGQRQIQVTTEAYDVLSSFKHEGQSFSGVILEQLKERMNETIGVIDYGKRVNSKISEQEDRI